MTVYKMWLKSPKYSNFLAMVTGEGDEGYVTRLYPLDEKFKSEPFSSEKVGSPVEEVYLGKELPSDIEKIVALIFGAVKHLFLIDPSEIYSIVKKYGGSLAKGEADLDIPDAQAESFEEEVYQTFGRDKVLLTKM